MKRWLLSGVALLIGMLGSPAPDSALQIDVDERGGELTIRLGPRPLLVYAFAASQHKPYVKRLHTLAGDNVLADGPLDHPHHHGLMYGVFVNGINFWEEDADAGVQQSVKLFEREVGRDPDGRLRARFTQLVHWKERAGASAALLAERRTLSVSVDEPAREVAVAWESTFQVSEGADKVRISGKPYNGLGLRFPRVFDKVARPRNSEGGPDFRAGRDADVSGARWSAVSFEFWTRSVTVAVFASGANPGERRFFTMRAPFTYLSATQGVDTAPQTYAAGATFSLAYLVTVYAELKTPEFLERRAQQWRRG